MIQAAKVISAKDAREGCIQSAVGYAQ